MVDKEQQINESNQMYGQLQSQLELMLDTVAKETNDIKRLEQQLNEGTSCRLFSFKKFIFFHEPLTK